MKEIEGSEVGCVPIGLPEFIEEHIGGLVLFLFENLTNELLPEQIAMVENSGQKLHLPKVLSVEINEGILNIMLPEDDLIAGLFKLLYAESNQIPDRLSLVNLIRLENQLDQRLDISVTLPALLELHQMGSLSSLVDLNLPNLIQGIDTLD